MTDALTDLQWFTEYGEVSSNYSSKYNSAPDLTALTLSLLGTLTPTREIILGSRKIGNVASHSYFILASSRVIYHT